jgi:hypothetical protein
MGAFSLASCSVIRPDGALASLSGEPPPKPKTYADRNHIQPTLPQGQLRWKVTF